MVGFDLDPELSRSLHTGHDSQSSESASSSDVQATGDEICTGKTNEKRSIAILYDGQMCTSTVTDIQANAIISMAKREMENGGSKQKKRTTVCPQKFLVETKRKIGCFTDQPQCISNSSQMLNQGLSMKHSLQRFLQKRKTRIATASPYSTPNCCSTLH